MNLYAFNLERPSLHAHETAWRHEPLPLLIATDKPLRHDTYITLSDGIYSIRSIVRPLTPTVQGERITAIVEAKFFASITVYS